MIEVYNKHFIYACLQALNSKNIGIYRSMHTDYEEQQKILNRKKKICKFKKMV